MSSSPIASGAKHFTGWSIAVSILMIVAGILAIAIPVAAGIAISIVLVQVVNRQSFHWTLEIHDEVATLESGYRAHAVMGFR